MSVWKLSLEEVAKLNNDGLMKAYNQLVSEDIDVIEEDIPVKGDQESFESFREYLITLIAEMGEEASDEESEAGSDEESEADIDFVEEDEPQSKCNPSDVRGAFDQCPNDELCNISTGKCEKPGSGHKMRRFEYGFIAANSEQELDEWEVKLKQYNKSLARDPQNKPIPPVGNIPDKPLFTAEFREQVMKETRITHLKDLAKQAGLSGYSKYKASDLQLLKNLILAKIDAGGPPKPSAQVRCDIANGKGCPDSYVCDVDSDTCVPESSDMKFEVINGMKIIGKASAINALRAKLGKAPSPPRAPPAHASSSLRDEVVKETRITKLKEIAKDIGLTGYSKYKASDVGILKGLILSKLDSQPSKVPSPPRPPRQPVEPEETCNIDIENEDEFKGCRIGKVCNIQTGKCERKQDGRVYVQVNGAEISGSDEAMAIFMSRLKKASPQIIGDIPAFQGGRRPSPPRAPKPPSPPRPQASRDPELGGIKLSSVNGKLTVKSLKDIIDSLKDFPGEIKKNQNKDPLIDAIRKKILANQGGRARPQVPENEDEVKNEAPPPRVPPPARPAPADVPSMDNRPQAPPRTSLQERIRRCAGLPV